MLKQPITDSASEKLEDMISVRAEGDTAAGGPAGPNLQSLVTITSEFLIRPKTGGNFANITVGQPRPYSGYVLRDSGQSLRAGPGELKPGPSESMPCLAELSSHS